MLAELACFEQHCRARFPIDEAIYNCPDCGGLLEVVFRGRARGDGARGKRSGARGGHPTRRSNRAASGAIANCSRSTAIIIKWSRCAKATRRCSAAPARPRYGGLDRLTFKHQGFNPTGSFKDNGMTCGVAQAMRLDRQRVACVSTGNTSASMAAYASAAGLDPIVFIPHGNISYGKLAQALEYGARTLQVEANFDQILALVRVLAERLGIYLLNSINPFRIEGQKTIIFEMLDQRDWNPPGLDRAARRQSGQHVGVRKGAARIVPVRLHPQVAAAGCDPGRRRRAVLRIHAEARATFARWPTRETLATAIKIGDPVSWPKALHEVTRAPTAWWRK